MIIHAERAEEAAVFNSEAGYHRFHDEETGEAYGSFEVFWWSKGDDEDDDRAPGWYWAPGQPGCLLDGDWSGPFSRSWLAKWDADPWAADNDPL